IDELCHVLDTQCTACDVKLLLFAAAASSEGYQSTLVPTPPYFMGESYYGIERLRRRVALWSSCRQMLDHLRTMKLARHTNSIGDIQLLHWVLIEQTNPKLRHLKVRRLASLCKDFNLQRPTTYQPEWLLSVVYKDGQRLKGGNRHCGFLGCPLQSLYRLLIMGRMDNNWTGPLRLYDNVDGALAQCMASSLSLPANCWSCSRFGRAPRCVLICEFLPKESAQQQPMQQRELTIEDTSCLRVHYLLLFSDHHVPFDLSSPSNYSSQSLGESFENRFRSHGSGQRYRGSRWVFSLLRWILRRYGHLLQRRQRTF
ncbi:hypothetical protein KR093_009216, partial [Drosophila rubida]